MMLSQLTPCQHLHTARKSQHKSDSREYSVRHIIDLFDVQNYSSVLLFYHFRVRENHHKLIRYMVKCICEGCVNNYWKTITPGFVTCCVTQLSLQ